MTANSSQNILDQLMAKLVAMIGYRSELPNGFVWDGYGKLNKPIVTKWSPKYLGGKPSDWHDTILS